MDYPPGTEKPLNINGGIAYFRALLDQKKTTLSKWKAKLVQLFGPP